MNEAAANNTPTEVQEIENTCRRIQTSIPDLGLSMRTLVYHRASRVSH